MKYFDDVKYPSMSMDNEDISEESIYRSVDELLKSHLYSAKTALPCMGFDKLLLWVDYDFFEIKRIAEKRSCERVEISEDGVTGEKKTRKFYYHVYDGDAFALSPSFQALAFVSDRGISKFGVSLKAKLFGFLPERELRYLELERVEEPFLSVDLEFFRKPAMVSPDEYRKRLRQQEVNNVI